jgi:pilus assembly protein Flp/PilA
VTEFLNFTKRLWKDEEGATAIEYGLLAALIAVAIIAVVGTLGGTIRDTFQEVQTELEDARGGSGWRRRLGPATS